MTTSSVVITVMKEFVNHLLHLDPDTLRHLGDLDGKVICLRLTGQDGGDPFEFYVLPSEGGLALLAGYDGMPDVTISGNIPVFARMVFGDAVPAASSEIQISGDIELGQRFQRIFKEMDIDWEEKVSHVTGDVAAHRLGNAVRDLRDWGKQAVHTVTQDLTEYLQHESQVLARREQVEAFLNAVDVLRADTDRLEKRLQRLKGIA